MFQFVGFNMMFPDGGRNFKSSYRCFSVSMLPGNEREDVENGGKIIMPPSALDSLTRLNVEYPMLFKLSNIKKGRHSHAGVLEFVADEGKCYLPFWMMDNLFLGEGEFLTIENVSLPVANYSKFQPHSTEFLDITNPKAVLENALRSFACLTTGDVIAIKYNKRVYELCVLETRPGEAVSIIECDMNVEFEAPVGFNDNAVEKKPEDEVTTTPTNNTEVEEILEPFAGYGIRLDGKKQKDSNLRQSTTKKLVSRGSPDIHFTIGQLCFDRSIIPISDRAAGTNGALREMEDLQKHFDGYGHSMRK